MAISTPCIDREVLLALLEHGGADQEIASLEGHLHQCDRCGELFDELMRNDEMTKSIRGAKCDTETDIPALRALCERLSLLRPVPQGRESTADVTLPPPPLGKPPGDTKEPDLDFLAPAQKEDELGRLGNYRVLGKLGEGGMGVVFLAEDTRLHRKVALKTMRPEHAKKAIVRDRFLLEARAAAAVEHEHIVVIHQVGEDRGVPYLAMPLLRGESLEDRLDRAGKLPVTEALRIAVAMADGLAAAHEAGLIHRDVKPGNIWLEGKPGEPGASVTGGRVKLLDFGMARSRAEDVRLTQTGTIVGTPAFMAPEQARGEETDGRADLFSLGCVLYVMLTGQRPFRGTDTYSVLTALALAEPPAPGEINPAVPDGVSKLTMQLLAKDAARRPASAQETAKALRSLLEKADDRTDIVVPPKLMEVPKVVVAEQDMPRRGRRPLVLACALLVVGLLTAAGIVLRLQTGKGELVLEAGDEQIEVTVKQAGRDPVVIVLDRNTKRTVQLAIRDGEIEARELPDGVRAKTSKFELERGGRKVFTASMLLAKAPEKPAKDREISKRPPEVKPIVAREKPFVLMRKGAEAGEFKTFAALWEQHQPGDEVVMHGNGPFVLPRLVVKGRALVLRAAPGFRPIFREDESVYAKGVGAWITLVNGSLKTDGCDFVQRNAPPGMVPRMMLSGAGSCVLRNGRFLVDPGLVRDYVGPSLTVEDSLLSLGGYGLGRIPSRCEVTLTNNVILTGWLITNCEMPGGQTVRLTRNAIVCNTGAGGGFIQCPPESTGITVQAEGNLIDFAGSYTQPVLKEGFKDRLRWQGKNNVYAGLKGGLPEWNKQLAEPEVNSRTVRAIPFAWTMTHINKADQALAWWGQELVRARRETGLPGLGPNLSLLGPGEAYLRALEADGKAVPKEKRRPEPLAGGRVVLLRGGKEVRGFFLLQQAFDAAQDGDVIEVRSDARLAGGETRKDSGKLTLRAAPGYLPVIAEDGVIVRAGTALEVEGLAFGENASLAAVEVKDLPRAQQGRIVRLASCSFDRRMHRYPNAWGFFLGQKDGPAEVTRCVFLGRVRPFFREGVRIRFRECIFHDAIGTHVSPGVGTYEMERCIACHPWYSVLATAVLGEDAGEPTKDYRWVARDCLLESAGHLFHVLPTSWVGERNAFRIGTSRWGVNTSGHGLLQWRAQEGVKETDSVEAEPWITNPLSWKLTDQSIPEGIGPDIGRIARR